MHQADRSGPPADGEGEQIPGHFKHEIDAATLLAAARSVRRGAWWRAVRREGWSRAPGVARAFGILAVLACLAAGGGVSLPSPRGLFRGGEIREGAVDRARGPTGPLSPSGMEIDAMRAMKMSAEVVVGSLFAAGAASAQTAVEWKVSEGGNGHWYAVAVADKTWTQARTIAEASGGSLASFNSSQERAWCFQLTVATPGAWRSVFGATRALGPWIGGWQLPGSAEPSGGWIWTDGSPVDLVAAGCDLNNASACGVNEDRLSFWGDAFPMTGSTKYIVSDFPERGYCESAVGPTPSYIIEWSADCNGDGIVDYGQILSGELADANANNIPDCCEQGTGCPANIVTNGSFEAGTPLNACSSESVTAGTSIGTGWQVTSGSVQRVRASSACAAQGTPKFGDFFVDLLDAGEIRQAVATTPGRSYRLTFWVSGDCAGGPTTKRVTASLGTATQTFDHACSGSGTQAWRSCSLEFIANSAITTLSLKSAAGGATNGPLVDGVRVEDISISCPGDVDGDGSVTGGDVSLVLLNFGDCPSN